MHQQPLSDQEQAVLLALKAGASPYTKSQLGVLADLGEPSLRDALDRLVDREPPLAEAAVDEGLNERVWISTNAGNDALDAAQRRP